MNKITNYYPLLALIFIFAIGVVLSFYYFPTETKINILMAFVTFLVGILVVYLYIKQKEDTKRDAAKIILQEIRRAENIISDYKQNGEYKFAKKIIATNNWSKNLHLFVGDLEDDELDRISNLYSTGEYLDVLVKEISDYTFREEIKDQKPLMFTMPIQNVQPQNQNLDLDVNQNTAKKLQFVSMYPPWKPRLELITSKLEPIYHSTIALKLKKIAELVL